MGKPFDLSKVDVPLTLRETDRSVLELFFTTSTRSAGNFLPFASSQPVKLGEQCDISPSPEVGIVDKSVDDDTQYETPMEDES